MKKRFHIDLSEFPVATNFKRNRDVLFQFEEITEI